MDKNRTFESKVMAVWIFLVLPWLFLSVSIYYAPESDNRVKIYYHLSFPGTFGVQFLASRYIMGLNDTPESKVMAVWFCLELSCSISSVSIYYWQELDIWVKGYGRLNFPCASKFNFECFNILCAWIGHPGEKLWPFEFLESFCCSISSVSIYHGSQ